MTSQVNKREDLARARTALEQLEIRKARAWNAWIKLEVGTTTEREARRRLDAMDERLTALRNRIARLEAETQGKRWLRPA